MVRESDDPHRHHDRGVSATRRSTDGDHFQEHELHSRFRDQTVSAARNSQFREDGRLDLQSRSSGRGFSEGSCNAAREHVQGRDWNDKRRRSHEEQLDVWGQGCSDLRVGGRRSAERDVEEQDRSEAVGRSELPDRRQLGTSARDSEVGCASWQSHELDCGRPSHMMRRREHDQPDTHKHGLSRQNHVGQSRRATSLHNAPRKHPSREGSCTPVSHATDYNRDTPDVPLSTRPRRTGQSRLRVGTVSAPFRGVEKARHQTQMKSSTGIFGGLRRALEEPVAQPPVKIAKCGRPASNSLNIDPWN